MSCCSSPVGITSSLNPHSSRRVAVAVDSKSSAQLHAHAHAGGITKFELRLSRAYGCAKSEMLDLLRASPPLAASRPFPFVQLKSDASGPSDFGRLIWLAC